MQRTSILAVVILGAFSYSAASEVNADSEVIKTGRYTIIKNAVNSDQAHPLKVVIGTRLPQSVVTIEDAVKYLLSRSGYQLADISELSDEAIVLLGHELPAVQRTISQVTLDKALMMLAGDAFDLVVDPLHRRIGFELKPNMVSLYGANTIGIEVDL